MQMKRSDHQIGQAAIFLCAILWSTSGLFIKLMDWHPILIAGARSFLAALVLLTVRIVRHSRRTGPGARGSYTSPKASGAGRFRSLLHL
jgi:drug/metabolite transporter (DMT)-like permease